MRLNLSWISIFIYTFVLRGTCTCCTPYTSSSSLAIGALTLSTSVKINAYSANYEAHGCRTSSALVWFVIWIFDNGYSNTGLTCHASLISLWLSHMELLQVHLSFWQILHQLISFSQSTVQHRGWVTTMAVGTLLSCWTRLRHFVANGSRVHRHVAETLVRASCEAC